MISGQEFKKQWDESLSEYEDGLIPLAKDSQHLDKLPSEVLEFLGSYGLPDGAAPYLSFDAIGSGLQRVFDVWGSPSDFSESEKLRLASYLLIGSDGAGNPLALDSSRNFSVVRLDHDDWFNSVGFVNSSIFHLAEFLLEVRNMISLFNKSGEQRNKDDEIPKEFKVSLLGKLKQIDSLAIDEGGFWESGIAML